MIGLLQDLKLAVRTLTKSPLFAIMAVLSLALGIGANTAIFTLLDQLLLRLLPVRDPQQLVMIWSTGPHMGNNRGSRASSYPMYQDYAQKAEAFSSVVLPPVQPDVDQLQRSDRARQCRTRFRQLFPGARRRSGGRTGLFSRGGRSCL